MASGRFVSTSIADDERLSKLSLMSEFIYLKTIPHLDRDGMITGKPGLLYSRVCPAREELFGGLLALINEWVAVGLVVRFDGPEGPVLFFPGFLKNNNLPHYHRERASKFPAPPGYIRTEKGLKPVNVNELSHDTALDLVMDEVQECVQDVIQDIDLQEQEQEEDQDQPKELNEDEDAQARDPIHQAWFDTYQAEMPEQLEHPITALVLECGLEATIHGIVTSSQAKQRTFKFIEKCARNYIPPAPLPELSNYTKNGNGANAPVPKGRYSVDIPGVVAMPASARASPPLPPPLVTDDPWAIALAEILPALPPHAAAWLKDSRCEQSGELAGYPLYRVYAHTEPGNIGWLEDRAAPLIRKTLSSILRKRIEIDIVAAEGVAA